MTKFLVEGHRVLIFHIASAISGGAAESSFTRVSLTEDVGRHSRWKETPE
jgi:hypothetical protein